MIISICCNNPDNGSFTGRLLCVDYASMELRHDDWLHGCAIAFLPNCKVRISRRTFEYEAHREWFGNWCWDGLAMRRHEAGRLLRYLHDSGCWACEGGPTRLFDWFNAPKRQTTAVTVSQPSA